MNDETRRLTVDRANGPYGESGKPTERFHTPPHVPADPATEVFRTASLGSEPQTVPIPVIPSTANVIPPLNGARTRPKSDPAALAVLFGSALFALFILRWVFFSFASALLVTAVDGLIVGGYLFFRQRDPLRAHDVEQRAASAIRRALPGLAPIARIAVLLGAAMLVLFLVRSVIFSTLSALLVTVVDGSAVGGYLFFRQRDPHRARPFEYRVWATAQKVAAKLTHLGTRTPQSRSPQPPEAQRTPLPSPADPPPAAPRFWNGPTAGPPRPHPWPPGPGYGARPAAAPGSRAVGYALLTAASVAPFVIIANVPSFTSVWEPWWIRMANIAAVFLVIVAWPAPWGKRGAAASVALIAAFLYVFSTIPAPDFGMPAMAANAMSKGNWSEYTDLTIWAGRMPVIAAGVFVIAWALATRRNTSWAVGVLPTALIVAAAIWFGERGWIEMGFVEMAAAAAWLIPWVVLVGPFVLGCLVCAAFDRNTPPRPPHVPMPGPR